MNKEVKSLYSCCEGNKVIFCDSNLSGFIDGVNMLTKNKRSVNWYYRRFKKCNGFEKVIERKVYFFQSLL